MAPSKENTSTSPASKNKLPNSKEIDIHYYDKHQEMRMHHYDKNKEMLIHQYEKLLDSLKDSNNLRENFSNFWITINSFILTAAAYVRDSNTITGSHKCMLIWTLLIIGVSLCLLWMSYLNALKKTIYLKNEQLVEIEKLFPIQIFTKIYFHKKDEKSSLTSRLIMVPTLFLIGYIFFAGFLYFFPYEVVTNAPSHERDNSYNLKFSPK